jgi:hypothetical protein
MWRILYPIQYFRLSNADKRWIDIFPTIVLAAVISAPFIFFKDAAFFKADGFLDKVLTLTSALTGFYVAALVAAATFTHPDLDKVIKVGPVQVITRDADGNMNHESLTRREFACMIFGYLAASTLLLSLAIAFSIGLSTHTFKFDPNLQIYVRGALIIFFAIWISHITAVTSLGLFYLMDRLHRHDPKILAKKSDLEKSE